MNSGDEFRTLAQVAEAIGWSEEATLSLLVELQADGIAERHGEGWRLTREAYKRFGRDVRDVTASA